MASSPRSQFVTFCVVTSVIATVLRGVTVWSRGILEHDEGHALLNANTWHQVMRWVLGGGLWANDGASIAQLRDSLHQQGGTLYSAGKFGYSLLLATVALPGEVTTRLGLLLALFAGVAVCVLAGFLTWQYTRNVTAAALTLFGCAMSPLLGYLSREVSGTIWALVFGLAATCALQAGAVSNSDRQRWAWGLFGGLLMGYGFTCHFNLAPFIVAIFLATGIYGSRGSTGFRRAKLFVVSVIPAAIGSLFMLAVFEAITRVADYRLRDAFPEYLPLSGELSHFLQVTKPMYDGVRMGDGAVGWGLDAWLVYAGVAWREGIVWMGFLLLGLYFAFAPHRPKLPGTMRSSVLLIVPLLFWAAYVYRVERVMGMCVVASWVFIGVAAGAFCEKQIQQRNKASLWLQSLLAAHLFISGLSILNQQHSPIPAVTRTALQYVKSHGGQITAGSFSTGFAPLWKWTIVEQMRDQEFTGIRGAVDFSRFDGADIIFIDPSTWNQSGGSKEFAITKDHAQGAQLIIKRDSESPQWHLESRDLRMPASYYGVASDD